MNHTGIVVEDTLHHGNLEVECVVRKADGTIKNVEKSVRAVTFKMGHGNQVTEIKEV